MRELGGLCIIGTERHESRRIDNQLRGRSGRQGDPGQTQFFISHGGRSDASVRRRTGCRAIMKKFGMQKMKRSTAGVLSKTDRERAEEGGKPQL